MRSLLSYVLIFAIFTIASTAILFFYRLPTPQELIHDLTLSDSRSPGLRASAMTPPFNFSNNRHLGADPEKSSDINRRHLVAGSRAYEAPYCPPTPPKDYPKEFPILDVINNWNPDVTSVPAFHYAGLCRFDFQTQREQAKAYRDAEVPFIVSNVPSVNRAVKKWGSLDYLESKFGKDTKYLTEYSTDNHFIYFTQSGVNLPKGWKPPVEQKRMSFRDWTDIALKFENVSSSVWNISANEHSNDPAESFPHYYFRSNSMEAGFIKEDINALSPGGEENFFIINKRMAKGIHCRFGMRGIVAAAHYDGSRNMIAILGGYRRYILTNPNQCGNLYLYPHGHPSGRHSEADWSKLDVEKYPKFKDATANEVILSAGDVMYLPSGWIHYVMSLNMNWQCNARSGKST